MLPAKQHLALQRRGFAELHDFSGVKPLFNVRSCLVIRRGQGMTTGIPLTEWKGEFSRKNMRWKDAESILTSRHRTFDFIFPSGTTSPYFDRFFQGATLVPRALCFVEPVPGARLNRTAPFVRTSSHVIDDAKKPWTMQIEGQVESKFLFGSVLAKDLMPFCVRQFSLVALPLMITKAGSFVMIDADEALNQGHQHGYDWFSQTESIWVANRKAQGQTLAGRLNYHNTITAQKPGASFVVIYNQSGTNISASLVTRAEFRRAGDLQVNGYVIDSKTYYHYTESEAEGHYLVGLLNTNTVNEAIKPLQPQGLMGERDIHRRPFEACDIPLFDPADDLHSEIARVSAAARAELISVVPKMDLSVARARAAARGLVAGKLAVLDELTRRLLGSAPVSRPKRDADTSQTELL